MWPHSLICRTKFVLLHLAKKISTCYENNATVFFSHARPGSQTPAKFFPRANFFQPPPPPGLRGEVQSEAGNGAAGGAAGMVAIDGQSSALAF